MLATLERSGSAIVPLYKWHRKPADLSPYFPTLSEPTSHSAVSAALDLLSKQYDVAEIGCQQHTKVDRKRCFAVIWKVECTAVGFKEVCFSQPYSENSNCLVSWFVYRTGILFLLMYHDSKYCIITCDQWYGNLANSPHGGLKSTALFPDSATGFNNAVWLTVCMCTHPLFAVLALTGSCNSHKSKLVCSAHISASGRWQNVYLLVCECV